MHSSCDLPLFLHPAYREEPKTEQGYGEINVPVYNEEGDITEHEKVGYTWEKLDNRMCVQVEAYSKAFQDDVHDAIRNKEWPCKVEFM